MIKSKKSTKTKQKQLKFSTRTNQSKENTFYQHEKLSTIKTSIKNMSDSENCDSSFELFSSKKPKYNNSKQKLDHVKFDLIDLTNLSDNELKDLKFRKNEKRSSFNINCSPSIHSISSSSDESFKSVSSSLSNSNNLNDRNSPKSSRNDNQLECNTNSKCGYTEAISENNCVTPKEKHIKIVSESAKLLDRIYGKKWREIDGVINDSIKKNLTDDSFENDNKSSDNNKLNLSSNNVENSFFHEVLTKNSQYLNENSFHNEVEDTSILLENISISDDLYQLSHEQLEIDSQEKIDPQANLNDIKQTSKSKTLKKGSIVKKIVKNNTCINEQSKELHNSEAKLSFLSSLSCFTGSMKCDPEAEKYKFKFKKNKDTLVSVLFKLFNKEVFDNKLPADLNFKWNARLRSTAGACFNKRSVKINENLDCERISRIELSSKIIDTAERLRDTLIHELCHAACWIFNGISEGHGPSWKSWANKAMNTFPELPVIKRCHSYDVQTKFTYKCKKCGYSFGRHSKSLNLEKKRCGYCYGEFELVVNKINKNQGSSNNLPVVYTDPLKELYDLTDVQEKPKLPRKPSKFALFVKENYGKVKRENPLSKHGEVMKLLGSKFATTKILTPDEMFDQLLDS